jgi:4-hydroxybenzoate polyprenyltransferase
VITELIDAPHDRLQPVKKDRPVPLGLVRPGVAVLEWLLLGVVGIGMAGCLNTPFMVSGLALWLMGIVYNIPPVRSKELPYLDVLSESVNNPLRLFLGWFALMPGKLPPLSLTVAYWMVGAFFMATKRFAEYRRIGDAERAAQYRKSFGYYTEERLLVSMFFYATLCALMAGIFLVRYHVELILFVPVAAGFFAYYLKIGLQDDSPVQNPEKLCSALWYLCSSCIPICQRSTNSSTLKRRISIPCGRSGRKQRESARSPSFCPRLQDNAACTDKELGYCRQTRSGCFHWRPFFPGYNPRERPSCCVQSLFLLSLFLVLTMQCRGHFMPCSFTLEMPIFDQKIGSG